VEGISWGVVQKLGLVAQPQPGLVLVYGSADPLPNPAELLLTQLVANKLGLGWRFFVYRNGKNLALDAGDYVNPPGVFNLESIIPEELSLRQLAKEIWNLRGEPVVIAHHPDGRPIRATSKTKNIPNVTLGQLHTEGGWFGGNTIHFLLRKYAEEHTEVVYLCPFQTKGLVYRVYEGIDRPLFILTPFIRIAPKEVFEGWEPITWSEWLSLPAAARRQARRIIRRELERFFRRGEPRRIEVPWGWWNCPRGNERERR